MILEHREYVGTLLAPFNANQKRTTKSGYYLDFNLDVKGKILPCRVWEEVFEAAGAIWEAGKKIAIFGYMSGEQLRVKVAREADKPALAKHLAFNGQTKEEAHADVAERIEVMRKKGFEAVWHDNALRFLPDNYTVTADGKRQSKIEFAMEKLGSQYVVYRLRAEKFVRTSASGVTIAPNFGPRYREVLDQLVQEAMNIDAEPF